MAGDRNSSCHRMAANSQCLLAIYLFPADTSAYGYTASRSPRDRLRAAY